MVKSKLQKVTTILRENKTLANLFDEFAIDFDGISKKLIENCLFKYDSLIQENTVYNLSENPNSKGQSEVTLISLKPDVENSLNGTYFMINSVSNSYYVWYSTGTAFDPNVLGSIGLKVEIATNEITANIAAKTKAVLEATGDFIVETENVYENVPAVSEATSLSVQSDLANNNTNYSGKYFSLYNGEDRYNFWFSVNGSTNQPIVAGTMIKVDILSTDTSAIIANKLKLSINALAAFAASSIDNTVIVEAAFAGESSDFNIGTLTGLIFANVLAQGRAAYTQVSSELTVTNKRDGAVNRAANSVTDSPDFVFTRVREGHSDYIAVLNESVSIAIGMYERIEGNHEANYRMYKSSTGVLYTYLLKWIYYCYKYFNEEQFFFNNLLDHFVPDYDSRIISSTTNLKVYFDGLGILLDQLDHKIESLYSMGDIDTIDEKYLQHIAQLLGYQKEDWSIQNISFRELIKNLTEIYKRKGTVYSFELFFKLLGFEAQLREYYWDRDAENPEGFASITKYDYLYYLTVTDPRTRTVKQIENMVHTVPIQPVSVSEWVQPKDLRDFSELQSKYSLEEILGFKCSDLAPADRFTYFKTNFINFKLTQFYTKQDLTAKDTDTILKYVKFLTPIYVSAFIEVVTTPWVDNFENENPLASEVVIEGNPGTPHWVDIILPFLYVTLKDYIPITMAPAPENAVILIQHATSDLNQDGYSDSALPFVFGDPSHGINVRGSVNFSGNTVDLTTNKFVNLRVDKGRGFKIVLQGNTINTYNQLISALNTAFAVQSIPATAFAYGVSPNIDIRVKSNITGTGSKIYMSKGLIDDLFTSIGCNPEAAVDGKVGFNGYQEFGLTLTSLSQFTGLDPSKNYNFYIAINDDGFEQIDVSGINPAYTNLSEVINSINNHYILSSESNFVTSTVGQHLAMQLLNNGKLAIAFRDVGTNNGKMVIVNSDSTPYRAGINFSRFDCRNITIAASNNIAIKRFFLAYYDISTNQLKWTVFNNEGDKEINDRVLEGSGSQVVEVKAVTLKNNNVAVIYTVSSPTPKAILRIINLESLNEVGTATQWYNSGINNIAITTNGDHLVAAGSIGSGGGLLVYLKNDGSFAIDSDINASTKTFTNSGQLISDIRLAEVNSKIFIAYKSNKTTNPTDLKGYITVWSDGAGATGPSRLIAPSLFTGDDLLSIDLDITKNSNLIITYLKQDYHAYAKVYNIDCQTQKKEFLLFDNEDVREFRCRILANGDLSVSFLLATRGYFEKFTYLGNFASQTVDGRLQLDSLAAGNTWDDTVENYAQASDQGHRFTIDGATYEYDNFSTNVRELGYNLTDERNRFNTFYSVSPNDDLVPLIQDTISLLFTVLIATDIFPNDNVDKVGFYLQRNGYITRNNFNGETNSYYSRHIDFSEDIRVDPYRAITELKWPNWKKESQTYSNWSSWQMGIDEFKPSINYTSGVITAKIRTKGNAITRKN